MFITHSYAGDIDATKQHMLAKNWTREELERVGDTPGLLMINVDFDVFEPREHPWLHLGFGNAIRQGKTPAGEYGDLLNTMQSQGRTAMSLKRHVLLFTKSA